MPTMIYSRLLQPINHIDIELDQHCKEPYITLHIDVQGTIREVKVVPYGVFADNRTIVYMFVVYDEDIEAIAGLPSCFLPAQRKMLS